MPLGSCCPLSSVPSHTTEVASRE